MKEECKVFIRGVEGRGDEVINALKAVGGKINPDHVVYGDDDQWVYLINHSGFIDSYPSALETGKIIMDNYTELHLLEKWKDGDILIRKDGTYYKVFSDYDLSHITTFYAYNVSVSIMDEKIISDKGCVWVCDRKDYRLATPSEIKHFHELLHKYGKDWDVKKRLLVNWKYKPKYGDMYWVINTDGCVKAYIWNDDSIDNRLFNLGNYFCTREGAETMAEKFKKLLKDNL